MKPDSQCGHLARFVCVGITLSPFLVPSGHAQSSLAEVTGKTTPERVADIAWNAITTTCPRPNLPSPSVFLSATSTSRFKDRDNGGALEELSSTRTIFEFRTAGRPELRVATLTEDERLNGIQWAGTSELPATSVRFLYERKQYHKPTERDPWSSFETMANKPFLRLKDNKGQWSVEFVGKILRFVIANPNLFAARSGAGFRYEPDDFGFQTISKLDCSQLTSPDPLREK